MKINIYKKTFWEKFAERDKKRKLEQEKNREDIKKAYNNLNVIEKIEYDNEVNKFVSLRILVLPFTVTIYLAITALAFLLFGINLIPTFKIVVLSLFEIYPIILIMFLILLLGAINNNNSTKRRLLLGK